MPHDKLIFDKLSSSYKKFVTVDFESKNEFEEDIANDPLIRDCL